MTPSLCRHLNYPGECVPCEIEKCNAVQIFWRCEHHPVATENFFEKRAKCEWGCHKNELEWYHCGVHPYDRRDCREPIIGV
jgi:hypothetical protein